MIINTNLAAITANKFTGIHNSLINDSMKKLSSGLRINSASDDPAGLGISEEMRSKIQSLNMAEKNCDYGVSMLQVADGALNEIQGILNRMNELTIQSLNDTFTTNDREKMQVEIDTLSAEIDRIAISTEFNNIQLLNVAYDNDVYSGTVESNNVSMGDFLINNDSSNQFTISATGMKDGGNINFVQKEANINSKGELVDSSAEAGSITASYNSVTGDITFEIYGGWDDGEGTNDFIISDAEIQAALADAIKEAKEDATNSELLILNSIEITTTGTLQAIAGKIEGLNNVNLYGSTGFSSDKDAVMSNSSGASINNFILDDIAGSNGTITGIVFEEVDVSSIDSSNLVSLGPMQFGVEAKVIDGVLTIYAASNVSGMNISASMIEEAIRNAEVISDANGDAAGTSDLDLSGATFSFQNGADGSLRLTGTASGVIGSEIGLSLTGTLASQTTDISGGGFAIDGVNNAIMDDYTISNISGNGITNVVFQENKDSTEDSVVAEVDENGVLTITISGASGFYGDTPAYYTEDSEIQEAIRNATVHSSLTELDLSTAKFTTDDGNGIMFLNKSAESGGSGIVEINMDSSVNIVVNGDYEGVGGIQYVSVGQYEDLELRSLSEEGTGMGFKTSNIGLMIGYKGEDFDPKYIQIYDMRSKSLNVNDLNLLTNTGGQNALSQIGTAIDFVSSIRTKYGALQTRLEHTTNFINSAVEFTEQAKSKITDVDMAEEMQKYSKNVLLRQTSQAMLAQANIQPREAWSLLYHMEFLN